MGPLLHSFPARDVFSRGEHSVSAPASVPSRFAAPRFFFPGTDADRPCVDPHGRPRGFLSGPVWIAACPIRAGPFRNGGRPPSADQRYPVAALAFPICWLSQLKCGRGNDRTSIFWCPQPNEKEGPSRDPPCSLACTWYQEKKGDALRSTPLLRSSASLLSEVDRRRNPDLRSVPLRFGVANRPPCRRFRILRPWPTRRSVPDRRSTAVLRSRPRRRSNAGHVRIESSCIGRNPSVGGAGFSKIRIACRETRWEFRTPPEGGQKLDAI